MSIRIAHIVTNMDGRPQPNKRYCFLNDIFVAVTVSKTKRMNRSVRKIRVFIPVQNTNNMCQSKEKGPEVTRSTCSFRDIDQKKKKKKDNILEISFLIWHGCAFVFHDTKYQVWRNFRI